MKRLTMTTWEAATYAGVDPRSFRRWARARGLYPLHRVRIGRSFVTVWSRAELEARHALKPTKLDVTERAC